MPMEGIDATDAAGLGFFYPGENQLDLDEDARQILNIRDQSLNLAAFTRHFYEQEKAYEQLNKACQKSAPVKVTLTHANTGATHLLKVSRLNPEVVVLSIQSGSGEGSYTATRSHELALSYSHDLLLLTDEAGHIQYISPSVQPLLGYHPEALLGYDPYTALLHPDEHDHIRRNFHEAILAGKDNIRFQHRMQTKAKTYRWFETYAQPIRNAEGEVYLIQANSRDITDRKATVSLLEETNQMALVGGWQYHLPSKTLEWTSETYRLHDLPVGKPIDVQEALSYYHPDYRNKVSEALNTLLRTGESYDLEALLITAEHRQRWVRTVGTPVWNADGSLKCVRGILEDITNQEMIKRELDQVKNRDQQLIETIQDVIFWLDSEGYFQDVNPMVYPITGYEQSALRGCHYSILIPEAYQASVADWFQRVLTESNPSLQRQIPILTKEGTQRWVDLSIQRRQEDQTVKEVFGIARDVTEQTLTQQALAHTSQRLRTLVDNLQTGILLQDENQTVYLINERFFELFDLPYTNCENAPESCKELLADAIHRLQTPSPSAFEKMVTETVENQSQVSNYEVTLDNGRILSLNVIPIYQEQQYLGQLWQYDDITRQKQEARELNKAKEEAEKASRAQADFLSTMSHEIRTPLNSVIGIAHILLEQNPRPDQLENLRALKFSGENLLNLINDILDFNKIKAGKIQLEDRPFDLLKVIQGIHQTHSFKADEKGLSLYYHFDERISRQLKGDPTRLSQIVNNLVSNAIKFTDEGFVTINVSQVEETQKEATLLFEVKDTGPGIPEESREDIFKSFTQASGPNAPNKGGTGLGIAITQRLLNLYNSNLELRTAVGEGTSFFFYLTLAKATEHAANGDQSEAENGQSLAGYHILMAEDNEMNTFMARQFLEKWGLSLTAVQDGEEAVQAAATTQFDVILMDLQMPRLDGYQAAEKIRQLPGYSQTPIIALTASAFAPVQQKVLAHHMDDALTKPFNPQRLYQKVQHYLLSSA